MKILLTAALILQCILLEAEPAANYLITEKQFGPISATTTYADLLKLFGKSKVQDESRTGAEGEGEYTVTVVNKNTPQELTVFWPEGKLHGKIIGVECTQPKSPYYTADSLKVGSTLPTLVKANKAPVSFYGFAWDYGGTITGLHKGKLDGSAVSYHLRWKPKGEDTSLMGEAELNSNLTKVKQRASQIYISKIEVNFEE
jgi:hypothetical protein